MLITSWLVKAKRYEVLSPFFFYFLRTRDFILRWRIFFYPTTIIISTNNDRSKIKINITLAGFLNHFGHQFRSRLKSKKKKGRNEFKLKEFIYMQRGLDNGSSKKIMSPFLINLFLDSEAFSEIFWELLKTPPPPALPKKSFPFSQSFREHPWKFFESKSILNLL